MSSINIEPVMPVQLAQALANPPFPALDSALRGGRPTGLDELAATRDQHGGRLAIGVMPLARALLLPQALARFARAWPGATVNVVEGPFSELLSDLREGSLDLLVGAMRDLSAVPDVVQEGLFDDDPVIVGRADHPLAGRPRVSWREAAAHPLCLLSDDMQNRRILDRLAASLSVALRPAIVSNSFLGVCAHLRQGGYASIVPHTFRHLFGGTEDLAMPDPVDPPHAQAVGLVLSDRDPLPPMASALYRAVIKGGLESAMASAGRPRGSSMPSLQSFRNFV